MSKDAVLILKLEDSEKDILANTAREHGMTTSSFCRMIIKLGVAKFYSLDKESKVERKAKALIEVK
jgi:hypothetical protein